ncbi:MAG: glucose 1-dehydrogenase [SAR202 cluster bacterium]|nr:glucose 1-dehydrogenase [SAR202 cluster bacterium]
MTASMFDLSGKVAFITGGNGGIGKAIALGFAGSGAKGVFVAARNQEKSRAAVKEIEAAGTNAAYLSCDVTDPTSVEAAVAAAISSFGSIDIVVNNSGTTVRKQPQEVLPDEWDGVIDTNLKGVYLVSRACYAHLKARGGGKVINIGSMLSIFGNEYASVYAASKGGVVQYTKSCAVAWARDNIQVNAILPGWITTDMTAGMLKMYPERYKVVVDRTPAGKWGLPADIAGTAVFLASSASDFITGVSIPVDGGYSVK